MTDQEYLKKYYKGSIDEALKRLNNGEPVQYIVGNVSFYGLELIINKDVLIPRFETEELVSRVIKYSKDLKKPLKIADIGTGSGAIAITLKKNLDAIVTATDISAKALAVAKKNAFNNSVDIEFKEGNLLEPLSDRYDIIVSNPPYISYDEEIMDVVRNNEPHIALYADNNGLYCYEEMLKNIKSYINDKALIAFEIGEHQGEEIRKLSHKYLNNDAIIEKDLSSRDRFAFIFIK